MQQYIELLSTTIAQLKFLSDYDYLFFVGTALLLVLAILITLRASKNALHQAELLRQGGKEIVRAIEESNSDLRDRIARTGQSFQGMTDSTRKVMREELDSMHAATVEIFNEERSTLAQISILLKQLTNNTNNTAKSNNDDDASFKEIKTLFEQQGIFLHDRFSELAASEGLRSKEMRDALQAIRAAQQQHLEEAVRHASAGSSSDELRNAIVGQLSDVMLKERALHEEAQSRTASMLSDSMNRLAGEMDAKMTLVADKVSSRFSNNIASTMESVQSLQGHIDTLIASKKEIDAIGDDVSSLSHLLLSRNENAHDLPEMLAAMLPDDAFIINPLINGRAAAAQLMLPGDQGAVIIDNSVPLDGFNTLLRPAAKSESDLTAMRQRFGDSIKVHINFVADHFISPPDTGTSALMFVPSEAAFAEIQGHHPECVELANRRKVWVVSPTTLTAALNMARSALKDQRAATQLEQMRQALQKVAQEAQSFEARLLEIGDHVNNAMRSVQRAESAGNKLFGDVRGIAQTESIAPKMVSAATALPPDVDMDNDSKNNSTSNNASSSDGASTPPPA